MIGQERVGRLVSHEEVEDMLDECIGPRERVERGWNDEEIRDRWYDDFPGLKKVGRAGLLVGGTIAVLYAGYLASLCDMG